MIKNFEFVWSDYVFYIISICSCVDDGSSKCKYNIMIYCYGGMILANSKR